jgi:hypothetical protein
MLEVSIQRPAPYLKIAWIRSGTELRMNDGIAIEARIKRWVFRHNSIVSYVRITRERGEDPPSNREWNSGVRFVASPLYRI